MDLADDLKILRQLRVPHKAELIQWVCHILQAHPVAMTGLDGKDLKDLVFSRAPTHQIASILETSQGEIKGPALDKLLEEHRPRRTSRGHGPGLDGAHDAPRSSRPTDSRRRNTSRDSRGRGRNG